MPGDEVERFVVALGETLAMVGLSGLLSLAFGLPLALLLVATQPLGIWARPALHRVLSALVNGLRSTPFIILLVALIPFTRLVAGTTIGVAAAIVPLTVAASVHYARIAEMSLREVDRGLIEAMRAMGATRRQIVREALVPEALPGLVAGFTVNLVTLIGASAMAGVVGAGGLGDLAIRYGYQRFETGVMVAVVAILIAMVSTLQAGGDRLARHLDRRA